MDTDQPRKLTIDELRSYDDLENLTDEKAEEITETLRQLCLITHKIVMKQINEKNAVTLSDCKQH